MNHYIILSIKHSTSKEACFWRSNNAGYTTNPWQAGIYSQDEVEKDPSYYNDGYNAVAICINNSSLPISGLSICVDEKKVKDYRHKNKAELNLLTPLNS